MKTIWLFFWIFIFLFVLPTWLISIGVFVGVAKEKGCQKPSWMLWLFGIFASPIILGIYVIALPDRSGASARRNAITTQQAEPARAFQNELPAI